MKYELSFFITPKGRFGLPDGDQLVVPPGSYYGPTLDTITGEVVGHGSMPDYRHDDMAVKVALEISGCDISISDNFGTAKVEAESHQAAYRETIQALGRLMLHLSVKQHTVFEAHPISLVSEDLRIHRMPKSVTLLRMVGYDTAKMVQDLSASASNARLEDNRLNRSLEYFQQALMLYDRREILVQPFTLQFQLLLSSAFLNLYKAATTCGGDPDVDKRDWRLRRSKVGLDEEPLKSEFARLERIRHNQDVAHYSLDESKLRAIEGEFQEAVSVTAKIIERYILLFSA